MKRAALGALLLAVLAIVAVAGLSARAPSGDGTGAFVPEEFFDGRVAGEGTVTRFWIWTTPFQNRFEGRRAGPEFLLDENFVFADGTPRQVWRFEAGEGGRYSGDVSTEGKDKRMAPPQPITGLLDADGFHVEYLGYAPNGGTTLLRFRHDLAGQADGSVVNTVRISWWGIPVARSRAVFTVQPDGP